MPRENTILPVSSTKLEIDLLDTFIAVMERKLGIPDIPIKDLWNPNTCPEPFLKYLAAAWSVDGNIADFTTEQVRNLIRNSIEIHLRKGTVWAVKEVIKALGYTITSIIEGERDTNDNVIRTDGRWATTRINVASTMSIKQAQAAVQIIAQTAPVSRKFFFDFTAAAILYDGGINSEGQYTLFANGTHTAGEISPHSLSG